MIIGNGIDIIEIIRLQHSIEKYQNHFLDHIFTRQEQQLAENKGETRYAFFAGRWAAKEAIAKALGTGFGAKCSWTDIDISNDSQGRPLVTLSGVTAKTAQELGINAWYISISHDREYACANAIAEKVIRG